MMQRFEDGYELITTKEGLQKLQYAAHIFSSLSGDGVHARIKDTWCDYGAKLWYKQVVIYRNEEETDSFQITPNDREMIMRANSKADIIHIVIEDIKRYPKLYNVTL